MSFPDYSKYQNSRVDWMGRVPEHWVVMPIRLAAKLESGHTPSRSHPEYWEDCTTSWITLADVWQIREGNTKYIHETKEKISDLGLANSSARLLPKNTVILSRTASVGYSAIMGAEMATSQDFANWICGPTLHPEFLLYVFRSMQGEFGRLMMGSTHNTIYMPDIQSLRFAQPPLDEQLSIVEFLDRETSKIDALVAEQRRLIELLKEKRQAVISHAVTKGLNPDAPMKPSGIEWIGDIPQHWQVTKLGYYASIENGMTPSRENSQFWDNGDIPWLSSGEVNQYRIVEAVEFITSTALASTSLRVLPIGAVIIGMIGQGKTRGLSAILEIEATINQNMAAVVTSPQLLNEYTHYLFQAMYDYLREWGRGGQQAALNCEILRSVQIPLPPISEQNEINKYLIKTNNSLDALIAEAKRAIELLQERRTALISAAVTGKIDVRGLVNDEEEAA